MTTTYRAYAVRYGSARQRLSDQNFLFAPVRGQPMPLDYYFWVLEGPDRNVLIDAAFTPANGIKRQRPLDGDMVEMLAEAGFAPEDFSDLVLTHLHFDHTGFIDRFPKARIHLQRAEVAAAILGAADHAALRWTYEEADLKALIAAIYQGRVTLYDGDAQILPGITMHLLPGHSPGQAALAVETERGMILLATDVAHFYANLLLEQPFVLTDNLRATYASYARLRALQPDLSRLVAGHDPKIRVLYPPEYRGTTAFHPLHNAPAISDEAWLIKLDDYLCD